MFRAQRTDAGRRSRTVGLFTLAIFAGALFFVPITRAQDASEDQGIDYGGYHVHSSFDFGYRYNDVTGNQNTFNTFVNLQTGVRLFDATLDMHSLSHQGLFFDDLHTSNFGWGGDPNNVSRVHIDKNKWYDFNFVYRRDKNFWDYNLFANPLNPASPNPVGSPTTGCIVSPPSALHPGLPGYCSTPEIAQTTSPHSLNLARYLQDYDLTLLPQSRVRFRVGYSYVRSVGPGFFTTDSGTVPDFPERYSSAMHAYRFGVDIRILPRTTISYDQFLNSYFQNNTVLSTPAATPQDYGYQLANGTPVNLGYVWSTQTSAEALPCAAPILSAATTPPTANPSCNGFLSYSQVGNSSNFMPTERLRFQSNYFQKLEMNGSFAYSSANDSIPNFDSILNGYVTRTVARVSTTAGPAKAKRDSVEANWSGVYSVSDKFRIEDFFDYYNWRIPGEWATADTNIYGAAGSGQLGLALPLSLFHQVSPTTPGIFAALCPAPPYNQLGCPIHTSSSGADVTNEISYQFLGQDLKSNTFELQYDFTKRLNGRIGYLYTNRSIGQFQATFDTGETYFPGGTAGTAANYYLAARGDCAVVAGALPAGCIRNADGSITEGSPTSPLPEAGNDTSRVYYSIATNALVAGLTYHPIDKLSINGDFLFGYNSFAYTRISPRNVQTYNVHVTYTPKPWASLVGAVGINDGRNNVTYVANTEHDNSYSFTATLMPNARISIAFGYNYWNMYTQADICFNYSITYTNPTPPPATLPVGTSPPGVATTACPIPGASVGAAGLGTLSTYTSKDNFVHADVIWKPARRVTAAIGYGASFERGSTTILNPLAPSGTLDFNYQMPYAAVTINVYKGFSYKTAWNYYGFNQQGNTDPFGLAAIPLQDFNGNTFTFSFRYAF